MPKILLLPLSAIAAILAIRLFDDGLTSPIFAVIAFIGLFLSMFLGVQFREWLTCLICQTDFKYTENLRLKLILSAAVAIGFFVVWWIRS